MLKIATKGTSTYYVDTENHKFLRTQGEDASSIETPGDNRWVEYHNTPEFVVGAGLLFLIFGEPEYTWQKTTKVEDIVEISRNEAPKVP